MEAVKKGGHRQELHEKLRNFSEKKSIDYLITEIEKDPSFYLKEKDVKPLLMISSLIGRAPQQVHQFLKQEVYPYL